MKKLFFPALFIFFASVSYAQNVGIGTTTPHPSALLQISSTQKGLLMPVMDSFQRNAIASPAQGLMIYQSRDNAGFYYFAGSKWNKVGGDGNEWKLNNNNAIYTTRTTGIGTNDPHSFAALDITDTTKGLLIPRMTQAQRNLITTPGNGLMIFQTDVNAGFYYYESASTSWKKIGGDGNEWIKNAANDIYTNRNVGIGNSNPVEKMDVTGNINVTGTIKVNGADGAAGEVLTNNGNGTLSWTATTQGGEETSGNGTWGDCSVNAITAFNPVANDDGKFSDYFGWSVSVSGDYAIAGIPFDSEGAGLTETGSATIFKRNAATGAWDMVQKLVNPSAASDDFFGTSVAISGDYAIAGANGDDEGVGLTDNGSATIFKRNTTTGVWEVVQKLINPSASANDFFGSSVAISGDYAIVGAHYDNEGAGLTDNGSATIFKRNAVTGVWEAVQKLVNPSAASGDNFGCSVSISGDYAMAGAIYDSEGAGLAQNGSATIFKRNTATGNWDVVQKLVNPSPANFDFFGSSVAISGDYAIAGASGDDEGAGFTDNGSVSIFKRNTATGVWALEKKLKNALPASADGFGISVAITGDYIIIGASGDDEGAGLTNNGSASIYKRYGNYWQLIQKFTRPNGDNEENFGRSVGIDGPSGRFIVGAPGVNGSSGMAFFGKVR